MLLNSALRENPERIILITESGNVSCGDLIRRVSELIRNADMANTAKHLVCSAHASDVIAALLVCERTQKQIYIAHSYLATEYLNRLIEEQGIDMVLRTGLAWERAGNAIAYGASGFHVCLMTSGTTGVPKIARHTIEALTGRIRRRSEGMEPSRW